MRKLILAPSWATKCLEQFGQNRAGLPNFRCIWGPSRTYIVGGFWQDTGRSEYRRRLRYGTDPKWILERWRPPQTYGLPEMWEANQVTPDGFYTVGPFPAQGDYECVIKFSVEKGMSGYVPLEPGMVETAARLCWMGRVENYSDLRRLHEDELLQKERAQDEAFNLLWEERQHSHKGGLAIGAHAKYNHQEEIDDYARRIERANAFVNADEFNSGFGQRVN
jgi:hypothetical protein